MPRREIASFAIQHLQVLDRHGQITDPELEPDLGAEQLVKLQQAMMLAREADRRMLNLQRQGRLGTFPPCTGQEAAACASALAMEPQDWLVGSYRELGARLLRGESLEQTLLYYNGHEEGSTEGARLRLLPVQVILGSQLPHAVGLAYAARYLGEEHTAVVAHVGDGATSQGDFHEALNFAAVWQVPVVFICQNNGWAISMPRHKQTRSQTIAQKAIAYGMPGLQVDGNDPLAVYCATAEALARARAGQGPTLIEAVTYRLMMHTTADDPRKYRDEEEEQAQWELDPLVRFESYLSRKGIWDEQRQAELLQQVQQQVEQSIQSFEAAGPFAPDAPFDHVYGSRCEKIEAQRAEFLANPRQEG